MVLALGTFAAAGLGAWPGLTGGDAGELIAASHAFSTAHPPGYPLFVWLGGLTTPLLWGPLAHRYNLFSGLAAAAATGLLGAALFRWTRSTLLATAAALAAFCTPLMLQYSTRTEVFALNQAMAALVLLLALNHSELPSPRSALALGLAAGVGLANHQTLALLAAPLLIASVRPHGARVVAGAALGSCTYALVPLGALLGPEQAWGDVLSMRGFVGHVLRADYGTFQLAAEVTGAATPLGPQLGAFALSQLQALGWVGAPLAVLGAWRATRPGASHRPLALALAVAWLLSGPGFIALAHFPMSSPLLSAVLARFFLLPELPAMVFAALGVLSLGPTRVATALCAAALLGSAARAALFVRERPTEALPELYAAALLEPLPRDAVLLVRGDLLSNAVRYAQLLGQRSDVVALDQELLTRPWYVARHPRLSFPAGRWEPGGAGAFSLRELLDANPQRPFYLAGGLKPGDPSTTTLQRWPAALAERLLTSPVEPAAALARSRETEQQLSQSAFARAAARAGPDPWDQAAAEELWEARHRVAVAQVSTSDPALLSEGEERLWLLISQHHDPPAQYYRNAAIAASKLAHPERLRAALEKYLALAPADVPDRALFEAELARLDGN
ncbi:MAG: DUF2723 domain-containing protein [Archangiaceae bacterium]|nr:DUF2723 domain-containing protein [Archangiaceae bacterium]